MQDNYFINCSSCHTFSSLLLFPLSFSSCLSCPSFIFLCSLRALYNVFWLYSIPPTTPLQFYSPALPTQLYVFFKKNPSRPNCVALIFLDVWSATRSYKTIWTVTVLKKTVSPSPRIFRLYAHLPFPQWGSF